MANYPETEIVHSMAQTNINFEMIILNQALFG